MTLQCLTWQNKWMMDKPIIRAQTVHTQVKELHVIHKIRIQIQELMCVWVCSRLKSIHYTIFHTKHQIAEQQHRDKARHRSEQHKCRLKSASHSKIHTRIHSMSLPMSLSSQRMMLFFIFFSSFLRLLNSTKKRVPIGFSSSSSSLSLVHARKVTVKQQINVEFAQP